MNARLLCSAGAVAATALALLFAAFPLSRAQAHCFVGARFLPATLVTDDPCVADEMSIPTFAWFKTADNPAANEVDLSVDISKRITQDFGVTVSDTWTQIRPPGGGDSVSSPSSRAPSWAIISTRRCTMPKRGK